MRKIAQPNSLSYKHARVKNVHKLFRFTEPQSRRDLIGTSKESLREESPVLIISSEITKFQQMTSLNVAKVRDKHGFA